MGKIFCTECGEKLDDSAMFCSKCGNPVESDNVNNVKTDDSVNTNNSANNSINNLVKTISKEPKIIILCVVILLLIIGIFSIMGGGNNASVSSGDEASVSSGDKASMGGVSQSFIGGGNENLVDVTDIIYEINAPYGGTNINYDKYRAVVVFKLVPKETISEVTTFKVTNFKITYENGQTDDLGTVTFKNKNAYLQGTKYTFFKKYDVHQYVYKQKIHVSGEIVVDTLNEQNKVIGRLDYDTTAKAWSANYV